MAGRILMMMTRKPPNATECLMGDFIMNKRYQKLPESESREAQLCGIVLFVLILSLLTVGAML